MHWFHLASRDIESISILLTRCRLSVLSHAGLVVVVAAFLLCCTMPAGAEIYNITTNDGGDGGTGDCTLKEAVQAANSNAPVDSCPQGDIEPIVDIINLSGVSGDIVLAETLNLNSSITINGPATIDGNDALRLFTVSDSGIAILNLLDLTRGSSGGGAAVQNNDGTLTLTICNLTDNTGSSDGGAVQSTGTLVVTGCLFDGNQSGNDGGAINQGGNDDATITASIFSANSADFRGGALFVEGGSAVTVSDSMFAANTGANDDTADETDGGGAIFVNSNGELEVGLSVFDANVSTGGRGGAIFVNLSADPVTISDSSFDANLTVADGDPQGSEPRNGRGAAIYNQESITVDRCTFNGNIAPLSDGGAISNHRQGTAVVTNSSFFANGAGINGGAIHNADDEYGNTGDSTVELRNCTFDQNDADLHPSPAVSGVGGSIFNEQDEVVELWNTIVANGDPANCSGTMTSNGNNLETATDCGFLSAGDLQSTDPMLKPPDFNGAPTGTFLIFPFFFTQDIQDGGPPLGAGDPAVCAAPPVGGIDQVGSSRPLGHAICDMGAFESEAIPVELMSFTIE